MFISICLYVDKLSVWELTKSRARTSEGHARLKHSLTVCARPCTCLTPTPGLGKYCTVCSWEKPRHLSSSKWFMAWRNVRKVISHHTSKPFVWLAWIINFFDLLALNKCSCTDQLFDEHLPGGYLGRWWKLKFQNEIVTYCPVFEPGRYKSVFPCVWRPAITSEHELQIKEEVDWRESFFFPSWLLPSFTRELCLFKYPHSHTCCVSFSHTVSS